jgi:hypothetical protein
MDKAIITIVLVFVLGTVGIGYLIYRFAKGFLCTLPLIGRTVCEKEALQCPPDYPHKKLLKCYKDRCPDGYIFKLGKCYQQCPEGWNGGSSDMYCKPDKIKQQVTGTARFKRKCPEGSMKPKGALKNCYKKCPDGYIMKRDGTCVEQCPAGYQDKILGCKKPYIESNKDSISLLKDGVCPEGFEKKGLACYK